MHATRQSRQARAQHAAALALAVETGDRYQQARAHTGLAHTRHAASEHSLARQHWQHALTLYTDLGVPDADDVRARLAAPGHIAEDSGGG